MSESPILGDQGRLSPGQVLYGKYRITRFIGQGGFGEVYEVYDQSVKQVRAIKRLRPDRVKNAENLERLLKGFDLEIFIGAKIKSPNAIVVFTAEKDGPEKFSVMEFAPNGSLAAQIEAARKQGEHLHWKEVFRWAVDIAKGLAELHALGCVHRDIKPKNILLGENREAKIADFGVAQFPGETLGVSTTGTTQSLIRQPGTGEYQAPEQRDALLTKTMLPSADIYAFGCVLFELLTGEKYFFNQGQHVKSIRRSVPAEFDKLIARMTSINQEERPKNGKVLLQELNLLQRLLEEPTIPLAKAPVPAMTPTTKVEIPPVKPQKRSFTWIIWVATVAIVGFGAYQLLTSPQTFIPSPAIASPTPLPEAAMYVEYIVDSSEGMSRPLNGVARMELAYNGLQAHWASVPDTLRAGLRLFGHRQPATDMIRSCEDTELIQPIESFPVDFADHIRDIQPTGFTAAYSSALRAAMADLTSAPASSRAIILISGSENLCDQNPRDLTFNYSDTGLELPIYVVSLGTGEQTLADLQALTDASHGELFKVKGQDELSATLDAIITQLATHATP